MSFDETSPYSYELENAKLAVVKSGKSKGNLCLVLTTTDYILNSKLKIHTVLIENRILKFSNKNLFFM